MQTIIAILFLLGYFFIATEHFFGINKAAVALLTGVLLWVVYMLDSPFNVQYSVNLLTNQLGGIAGILFFLMGAMTIVETIDAHQGFKIITNIITTKNKIKLAWLISFITFFLSAVLDNLTAAIVMITIAKKLIPDSSTRFNYAGLIIIASNAGGAWSPIGDVTTTMLWIGGQITASNIIFKLFLPSLVCLLAPLLVVSSKLKGELSNVNNGESLTFNTIKKREQNFVFFSGIGVFLFVPVFHAITHLPPYMGILFGVGFLWIITAFLHKKKSHNEKQKYSVTSALKKIDTSGILFFLGILLAVAVLQNTALLANVANTLSCQLKNNYLITIILGLLSAIIDNVPLVAATMGMFNLEQYPTNHVFWELLAFTTGTGGSIFIIGSAAGIAVMGVEDISFIQYLKKISVLALIGFLLGVGTFWILN